MTEDATTKLAGATSTDLLCELWGASRSTVIGKQKGERPMTLHEAWTLARVNGVKLSTLLSDA